MTYYPRKKGEPIGQDTLYRATTEVGEIHYYNDLDQGGVIADVSLFSETLIPYLSTVVRDYIKRRGELKIQFWAHNKELVKEEIIKEFGPEFSIDA
jgi:hypothetical protein